MSGPNAEIVGYLRADVRRAVERDEATVTVVTAEAALALSDIDRLTSECDEWAAEARRLANECAVLRSERDAARAEAAQLREALVEIARVPMRPLEAQGLALSVIVDGIDAAGTWQSTPPTDQGEEA